MPKPSSSGRSEYGEDLAKSASTGTVTATPSIQSIPESLGPAPPWRASMEASTPGPLLWSSVTRWARVAGGPTSESVDTRLLLDGADVSYRKRLCSTKHGRGPECQLGAPVGRQLPVPDGEGRAGDHVQVDVIGGGRIGGRRPLGQLPPLGVGGAQDRQVTEG